MNSNRRNFIGTTAAGLAGFWDSSLPRLFAAEVGRLPDGLFDSPDPAVLKLANSVYQQCILGKVFPQRGALKHRWIAPGGGYNGQWIWDTMFVVDLLSILPNQQQVIREVFQNFWDFQVRWNQAMPDYARDMIACMINSDEKNWVQFPAYSQIPLLAWGVECVWQRNGDKQLVQQSLGPIERYHEWYWRERDVTHLGLVAVGTYHTGAVQDARWETFDYECNLDDLQLTRHPTRKSDKEGEWYGDLCIPGNSAYLVMAERCLMRLADMMGDTAMAARRKRRIDKSVAAMRQYIKDPDGMRGAFFMPHRNETGYWWSGENARLASLASAALLGRSCTPPEMIAELKAYGKNQVNWILGLNPYDLCMVQGKGRNNPADYDGAPNPPGGICNGITSGVEDEHDIAFLPAPYGQRGDWSWRWSEQWIPHASWLILALASECAADPVEAKRNPVLLDGTWQIAEGTMNDVPTDFGHTVPVPGLVDVAQPVFVEPGPKTENTPAQKDSRREAFWYRRTFRVAGSLPALATLKVGKAMFGTRVILNDRLLGDHLPCFTPGLFNAREALKSVDNELLIRVGADRSAVPAVVPTGFDYEKERYIPGIFDSVELFLQDCRTSATCGWCRMWRTRGRMSACGWNMQPWVR